ncbi:hypothetical protein ACRE1S_03710 [Helicobacter himalayensis]|uniref:hypothetical protein n=1 Tax=Helicobacter himalayensis TaxID=1591088 RepID=UPI003D6EFB18
MIEKISQISRALGALAKGDVSFNARLPIVLKVLGKLEGAKYLLQIGTKTLQTTSHKPLEIGQKYWGQMSSNSLGGIVLSNLAPYPKILDFAQKSPLNLESAQLQELLSQHSENLLEDFSALLLQKMPLAQSKQELEYLGFLLLGLRQKVISLSFEDKGKKQCLLQLKLGQKKLLFSAIMPSLGFIEGVVWVVDSQKYLEIKASFKSTLELLEQNLSTLNAEDAFESVSFKHEPTLKAFFEMPNEHILNVKG